VPHVLLPRDAGDAARVALSPIMLVRDGGAAPATCRVGVTLAGHDVPEVGAYDRLIAIVGLDDSQREAGRQRWREYQRAGHAVSNVSKPAGAEG
jgi:DNA polymerase III subunit chi